MKKLLYILVLSGICWNGCARKTHSDQSAQGQEPARRIEVLFLGHASQHHHSEKFAPMLASALFQKGINITYTADPADLNRETLSKYDGLLVYANHDAITPSQETALLEFVEGGKGFIPIHSASWSFRNSDKVVQMTGGQFKSHKTGDFTAKITDPQHPVMQGLSEFETWDETYVHSQLNPDNKVLMVRDEDGRPQPWTWVRNQGQGRVFYTAYGHDERTWNHPGFHKLVQNGIVWAVGDKVRNQWERLELPTPVYTEADVPNYENRDPAPKFQQPFNPAQSQKYIQVPVDFELQLFASEPDIINPMALAWDEKGRLWVIETKDYPNEVREEEGVGQDRIKILEDTNGDGRADKITVFAENLNIPTSMVFANGGVIISQAPHFLFLKDTDGDDKADVREIIMTGWGKSDTHAGPSNLKYGFDNKIWGVLGYSGFDGNVGGQSLRFGQGVYRFTPDGKELEFLSRTSNNTWGLGFSESNDVFISTANNTHSAFFSMPNQYLRRVVEGGNGQGVHKIDGHYDMPVVFQNLRQVDVHGGYTSAAGHNLYTARNFPKEYWNRIAFVAEPTGRVLHNAVLEQKGAGFTEKNGFNLLASSDEWFGPVHAEVGPDGAVWVADWYNFIIQHNPTPRGFENGKGNAHINPLRDREHGRIYRAKYKKAKPYTPIKLSQDDLPGLLAALENDNMFWRMHAQRLLVESKNQAALPGLYQLINKTSVDEIGLNGPAVHALWTLHGLGALNGSDKEALQVVTKALSHPAASVRKAAVQVLPQTKETLDAIQRLGLLDDQDLRVRLATSLALADLPASPEVGKLLYEASLKPENEKDEHLAQALFAAAITHQDGFMAAAANGGQATAATAESGALPLVSRIGKSLREEKFPLVRFVQVPTQYAPSVQGKEIIIRSTLAKGRDPLKGVVMAQGSRDNGYGLYVEEGKLHLVVRQNGKAYAASTTEPLPDKFELLAQVKNNGAMSIEIDGKQVAKGKAPGLFRQPLDQGMRVSVDAGNTDNLGDYSGPNWLNGNMTNGFVQLQNPAVGAKASASAKASAKRASAAAGKQGDTPPVTPTAAARTDSKPVGTSAPVPAVAKSAKNAPAVNITLKVVEHVMQFDQKMITVKAGQEVNLLFENPDFMQHNVLIIKPGTLEKVGAAADALARDPKGAEKHYVPVMPEVLYATTLVDPEGRVTLNFTAPSAPSDYPYVCTFPGHWRIMNGILRVEK